MVTTNNGVYRMGKLENIRLMEQFVMEADCYESKVFMPIIYEKEVYYPPSNIDDYYEDLWDIMHEEFSMPDLDDLLQDITLNCLTLGTQFKSLENAKFYYYKSLMTKSKLQTRKTLHREALALKNHIPEYEDDICICDSCLRLKPITFTWRDKTQYCNDCAQIVISKIVLARGEN